MYNIVNQLYLFLKLKQLSTPARMSMYAVISSQELAGVVGNSQQGSLTRGSNLFCGLGSHFHIRLRQTV